MSPRPPASLTKTTVPAIAGAAGVVLAAWLDHLSFAGYVAITLAVVVIISTAGNGWDIRLVGAVAAMGYCFAALVAGEAGILRATAATTIALCCLFVIRGLRPNAIAALSESVLKVVYLGSFSSFLILIRGLEDGSRLVSTLVVMVIASQVAIALVNGRFSESGPNLVTMDARGIAAGTTLSVGTAMAARIVLDLPIEPLSTAVLGLGVGIAQTAGALAAHLAAEDLSPGAAPARPLGRLNALLFAAPTFYYILKLYLS